MSGVIDEAHEFRQWGCPSVEESRRLLSAREANDTRRSVGTRVYYSGLDELAQARLRLLNRKIQQFGHSRERYVRIVLCHYTDILRANIKRVINLFESFLYWKKEEKNFVFLNVWKGTNSLFFYTVFF